MSNNSNNKDQVEILSIAESVLKRKCVKKTIFLDPDRLEESWDEFVKRSSFDIFVHKKAAKFDLAPKILKVTFNDQKQSCEIIMDKVNGLNLIEFLENEPNVTELNMENVILGVHRLMEALLKRTKCVYPDLGPTNIVITESKQLFAIDFDFAQETDADDYVEICKAMKHFCLCLVDHYQLKDTKTPQDKTLIDFLINYIKNYYLC